MKRPRPISVDVTLQAPFPPRYIPVLRKIARSAVQRLPAAAWKAHGKEKGTLSVSIVSPEQIRKLNQRYRKKDRPTDVLSFAPALTPGNRHLGDVVLCWKVAQAQCEDFSNTPQEEIRRLIVHGVLHLFGYDHEKSQAEAKRMFALENRILADPSLRGAKRRLIRESLR